MRNLQNLKNLKALGSRRQGRVFNPANLDPDAWYDTHEYSTVLTGNDTYALYRQPVATVKDLSGNGYDLTQGTAASQPLYLRHGEDGYLGLTGTNEHYAFVPSRSEYNITGDIDIRGKVSPVFGSDIALLGKRVSGKIQWALDITSAKLLRYSLSDNGVSLTSGTSTVALPFNNHELFHIRFTWNQTTKDSIFYTSLDGNNWTQLGDTLTANISAINTSDKDVEIGSYDNGTTSLFSGRIFQAQLLDGIDGTKVLDANFEDANGGETTWINSALGDTITINAPANIADGLTGKTKSYFHLPGESGNYASTPSQAKYNITGDIDLRAKISWQGEDTFALGKWVSGSLQYYLRIDANGNVGVRFGDSTGSIVSLINSSVPISNNEREVIWIRGTWEQATNDVNFYTSKDGENWKQLGTTRSTSLDSIFDGTADVEVGSLNNGNNAANLQIFQAQIRDGIDGTLVYDANFENLNHGVSSFTENEGATVTINSTGDDQALVVGRSMLIGDGVDDHMTTSAFASPFAQPNTVFNVGQMTRNDNGDRFYGGIGDTSDRHLLFLNSSEWSLNAGITQNSGVSQDTNLNAFTSVFNGSDSFLYLNGSENSLGDVGTNTIGGLHIMGDTAGGSSNFNRFAGFYGPVFIKNGLLSDSERNSLQRYYAKKYNITLS